jgi:hypothetical protein
MEQLVDHANGAGTGMMLHGDIVAKSIYTQWVRSLQVLLEKDMILFADGSWNGPKNVWCTLQLGLYIEPRGV